MIWEKLLVTFVYVAGYFAFVFGIKKLTGKKEMPIESMFWMGFWYLIILSVVSPKL